MSTLRNFLFVVLAALSFSAHASQWNGPDEVLAAAKAGNVEAQLEMGILYEYGFFMKDNRPPALAWYMLAAENGNEKAAKLADKLRAKMTPAEIQQAETQKGELHATVKAPTRPAPVPVPAPVAPAEPMETTPGLSTTPMETTPEPVPVPAEPMEPAPMVTEPAPAEPAPEQSTEPAPPAPGGEEGGNTDVVPLKDMAPVPQ